MLSLSKKVRATEKGIARCSKLLDSRNGHGAFPDGSRCTLDDLTTLHLTVVLASICSINISILEPSLTM